MSRLIVAVLGAVCWWGIASPVLAEDPEPKRLSAPFGFTDADHDGKNDLFRDAEGDGLDDVTGNVYLHAFPYCDRNSDGKNDYWQDADGDGRNDLYRPGKRIGDFFLMLNLDGDDNGLNDVTGKRVTGYQVAKPFRSAVDSIAERRSDASNLDAPPQSETKLPQCSAPPPPPEAPK